MLSLPLRSPGARMPGTGRTAGNPSRGGVGVFARLLDSGRRRFLRDLVQGGQPELHHLGELLRGERGLLAVFEVNGGELAVGVTGDGTSARQHGVHAAPARAQRGAGLQPVGRRLEVGAGEDAEHFLAGPGAAVYRLPRESRGIHEDGIRVLRLGIAYRPLPHVLPDRFVAVLGTPAGHVCMALEDALLEHAELLELFEGLGVLPRLQKTGSGRTAELDGDPGVGSPRLRPVVRALGDIDEPALLGVAGLPEVVVTVEHVVELAEVVVVTWRVDVAGLIVENPEVEVVEAARVALHDDARLHRLALAASWLSALHRQLVDMDDLHGDSPR